MFYFTQFFLSDKLSQWKSDDIFSGGPLISSSLGWLSVYTVLWTFWGHKETDILNSGKNPYSFTVLHDLYGFSENIQKYIHETEMFWNFYFCKYSVQSELSLCPCE